MKFGLIDLFCGAGGMSLGFTDDRFCGGFRSLLAIDNDRASVDTHEENFEGESICRNIEEWLAEKPKIPRADIVIGGPPCQGFSLLNKNRGGDKRRELWEPFLDVVRLSGSKAFVMENVAELYKSPELGAIIERADKLGFQVFAEVLNAADYGVPQARRRTIVVGLKKNLAHQLLFPPQKTHRNPKLISELPLWKTVQEAIGDLPPNPNGTEIGLAPPHNLHFGRNPTELSRKRYAVVPPGGNRFDLQRIAPEMTPQCWIRKKTGGTDLFGRLWWDRPSVTIRTEFFKPEKGRYLHPVEDRPITHREAARIMGFPDDFEFRGSKIAIAKQIGNAVPPPLAGCIAKMMRSTLSAAETKRIGIAKRPRVVTKIKAA